ncbi:MAG TPA: EamA family transporter, partial [Pseudoneobacillus sp.]|nr:EamA family transporter [Pseudoneobacillus sp.]
MVIFGYILMCLIFGTTFLVIQLGMEAGAPPFLSAGIRFLLAGLILFLWMLSKRKVKLSLLFQKEMLVTGMGLTFGTFATLYWAEQYVSSGMAAILSATGPIMIVVLQLGILRQRASLQAVGGSIIGFLGVVLLVAPHISINSSSFWLLGCFAILTGEIFYSSGALYSKYVINRYSTISPIALNAAQMIYGGGMLIILSWFTEKEAAAQNLYTPGGLWTLLYLTV